MPPRSKVAALPAKVKEWLDNSLMESNFSGYEALAAELERRGFSIGKSALH
ncbi:phage protein Gp27 family protein, partial [Klebsiella variicola]|uniref:phage protein Gp27 family protein n=2 Tax=Gammaproteobacteria TaxID=1236 RepID=UPI0034E8AC7E